MSDVFDEVHGLEEHHISEGFNDGERDGVAAGVREGRALGIQKGYEIGVEVGYYSGCTSAWRAAQVSAL